MGGGTYRFYNKGAVWPTGEYVTKYTSDITAHQNDIFYASKTPSSTIIDPYTSIEYNALEMYADPFTDDWAECDMTNIQTYYNNGLASAGTYLQYMGKSDAMANYYKRIPYEINPVVSYDVNTWAKFLNFVSDLKNDSRFSCPNLSTTPIFYTRKDSWGHLNEKQFCQLKPDQFCTDNRGDTPAVFPIVSNAFTLSTGQTTISFQYGLTGNTGATGATGAT